MNWKQKSAVVVMDIAILAELCISICVANGDPDNFTPLFFKCFFSMIVPTLILAKIVIKRLGRPGVAEELTTDDSASYDHSSGTAA